SIDIRVTDTRGDIMAGAMVIAGDAIDPARPWLHGVTDARGEVTLSGPGLVGPIDLHAGRDGFGGFSIIGIDRAAVTLTLVRPPPKQPDPLPDCPSGGGAPALVTGTVSRVKDEWNTGDDYVVVTTTVRSFAEPLPDGGPNSEMISQGPYELM